MNKQKIAKPKKFQQNREVKQHYHPRSLARAVAHRQMELNDMFGVNQKAPGTTQSPFSVNWRLYAERFSAEA